jgi:V8-like Glu-specific endopeptidase
VALGNNPVVLITTLASFALWVPWPVPANVFSVSGTDPRSYVAQNDALWRTLLPVGTVTSEFFLRNKNGIGGVASGMGTAFMVSPCYAMTNYHVLFGGTNFTPNPIGTYLVTLRFGLGNSGEPALSVKGRVRYWGSASSTAPDIALVRLNGCPGVQLGWYELAAMRDSRQLSATPLTMPSFSSDRSMERLSIQQGCRAHAYVPKRGWLLHDCATRKGASGAPLIANLSGVPTVIGINAGEFRAASGVQNAYSLQHTNWAVIASEIVKSPQLQAMLQKDRNQAQRLNPLL